MSDNDADESESGDEPPENPIDIDGPADSLWFFNPSLAWWLAYREAMAKYRTRQEAIRVRDDGVTVDLEEMR